MRSFLVRHMLGRHQNFFKKMEEFDKTQYYSEVEMQTYQEEKLQKLIKHAYRSTPFYRELFDKKKLKPTDFKSVKDLEKLPIQDKETLRSNREKMLSTNMDERTFTIRTGGSTGVPLSIINNYKSTVVERVLFYRFLQWLRYQWGDELVQIWGEAVIESNFLKLKEKLSRKIYNKTFISTFSLNDHILPQIIARIKNAPPKILRGYASSIYLLALKTLEYESQLKLNAVTTTAEKLFRFQRNEIERAFGKNIFDQYGCGETNSIAFECEKHKGLHVALEHVILELIDESDHRSNRGRVVITNLDNYAMPIIRYANGDLSRWASKKCDCGRNLPLLEEIEGRVSDFIEGPNKNKVHTEFFTHIFDGLHLAEKYSIREFRVVQEEIDKLVIAFVTKDDLDKSDEKIIRDKINQYMGKMDIRIKKVKSIPMTKMGKKRFVISLLNCDEPKI